MSQLLPISLDHPSEPCSPRQPSNRAMNQRRARFLEALSLTGNVRAACRSIAIAPMTAYRWRRACRHFAHGWDVVMVVARTHAEEVLADRALNGVEETIYYHGEEIGSRRRYDSRLLLAHIARLDAKAQDHALAQAAQDFDAMLDHYGRSGECAAEHERDEAPEETFEEWRQAEPPPGVPELAHRIALMEAARPLSAPPVREWGDPGETEALQLEAFEAGEARWWTIGAGESAVLRGG